MRSGSVLTPAASSIICQKKEETTACAKKGAVKTEMGSGKFAEAGRPNVAYVRRPEFYDTSWFSVEPTSKFASGPIAPLCYTRSTLDPDPVSGGHIFTFGGPGGKDPGCKWPFP